MADRNLEELKTRLPTLSEEELVRIATVDNDNYLPEAIGLVLNELHARGVKEVTKERYVSLKAEREQQELVREREEVRSRWSLPGRLKWIYPAITDTASARRATRQGAIAALVVGSLTAIIALLTIAEVQAVVDLGFSRYILFDAAIFFAIGVAIWRGSYLASIIGLGVFVCNVIYKWVARGLTPGDVSLILLIAFINGVRGARALRAFNEERFGRPATPILPM